MGFSTVSPPPYVYLSCIVQPTASSRGRFKADVAGILTYTLRGKSRNEVVRDLNAFVLQEVTLG